MLTQPGTRVVSDNVNNNVFTAAGRNIQFNIISLQRPHATRARSAECTVAQNNKA